MNFIDFIQNSFKSMSNQAFLISLIGLLVIFIVGFIAMKIISKSEKREILTNSIKKFNYRFIRFLIQLFVITFSLIMYFIFKDINKTDEIISSDIFLPIVLLITGKILYMLSRLIGREYFIDEEEHSNDRFTTLLVLISIAILLFMRNIYTGSAITGIILGKFFWFDTKFSDFINTLKSFKPTLDCFLAVIAPIGLMAIVILYVMKDINNLYGAFWGTLLALSLILTFIFISKRKIGRAHV